MNEKARGRLLLTEEGMIIEADASLLDLLGYNLEGLRGCHVESLLTRSSSVFLHIHFQTRMKLDGKIEGMRIYLRKSDGSGVPCLLHASAQERDGRIVHDCVLEPVVAP
ncbi:PAS domain S-box protein [Paenibacillus sacheonensis]|uniref:PAS domain S-box protein n=1 Tax=Paenibacillus sacheonensis TaxID=742054 RepID=A0A7X4YKX9_9BACL|nr:PAS domain S-box protein [Paenibacillus sacheonensis]MBM7563151.1 PAS domain S-box-containing protein [Paenibacillus sacheonensis]NBC68285.1 PAS domain S-box protein [Paenibacillus sacheonensis]